MHAEGRQGRIASKWHEDNLLGPGRKMRSGEDRWNEVVARENLEEWRAKLGGTPWMQRARKSPCVLGF